MSSNIRVQRICMNCGQEFTAKTTVTRYCSTRCHRTHHKAKQRSEKIGISDKETMQVRSKPLEMLKLKEYLSINETCQLIGVSRRTVYRAINKGELLVGKAGARIIIRRVDIEKFLFKHPVVTIPTEEAIIHYEISDCYSISEAQKKFGVSPDTLQRIIQRNNIPKIKKGWFTYIPKQIIDTFLS